MKIRNLALCAAVMIGLTNMVGAAVAQSKIYVINEERIRRDSKVGKEMSARSAASATRASKSSASNRSATRSRSKQDALRPQTQSLTKEALDKNPTLKAKVDALDKKTNEYLQKADILNSNLEQQNGALNMAFAQAMEPAVSHVAKQVGADVVLSYASTWYVKDAIDISAKVIERLDATVPSLQAPADRAAACATGGRRDNPLPQRPSRKADNR